MIRYIKICKKYFSLGANDKKYLRNLFLSATLRSFLVLLIPICSSSLVDYATIGNFKAAFIALLFLLLNYVIYTLAYRWNYVAYSINTNYVYITLRQKIVQKITTYDENFSKKISRTFLINTVADDTYDVCMFADRLFDAITHFLAVAFTIGILLFSNFYIGLLTLLLTILYLFLLSYAQKRKDYYLTEQRKAQDKIVGMYAEALEGSKEIQSNDMQEKLDQYLEVHKKSWTRAYFRKRKYYDFCKTLLPIIHFLTKIGIYLLCLYFIFKGEATVGFLVLVVKYVDRIASESKTFFEKINKICNSSIRIDRIDRILHYKNKNILTFGHNENDEIFGDIDFEKVSFTYENNLILDGVSFHIDHHSMTAIVGKSGSGKSTIFRLLLRLYKLDKGMITIDGTSIYEYSKDVYARNVSIVTQKPFIFNMSIEENLSLVDSNHKNQIEACKRVGIHDFIMTLPKKYKTILKEDATDISGGQKQLIALARTLLSKAEILLFDEVTSSLDPNTTKQVIKVLKNLKKDHTVIMITHKPKLMKMADHIIVVANKKIAGVGTHKHLLQNNKYYQSLQK